MKFYNGNNKHRILPMILAGIIIFSMLLGFFGMINAYASDYTVGESATITGYEFIDKDGEKYTNNEITSGESISIRVFVQSKNAIETNNAALLNTGSFTYDSELNGDIELDKNSIYYWVTFEHISYTGYGNLIRFDIKYKNTDITDTLAINISQCKTNKDDEEDDDEEPDPAKPYIIVSNYSYGGNSVVAGSTFQLKMKFYNTSPQISVENIVMEVNAGDSFTVANSSNKVFIKRLYANESLEKTIDLQVKPNAEPKSGTVEITFTYDYIVDDKRQPSATCSEKIAVPVYQVDRFEVGNIEVPSVAQVGEEAYLTIKLVNKGKSVAYNVSAEVKGDFVNSGASQFIGNIESGISKESDDLYIKADKPGEIVGELIIKYEDAANNQKQVTRTFNLTIEAVEEGMGGKGGMFNGEIIDETMGGKPQKPGKNWLLIIGISAGVVIVLIVVTVIIVKVVKKRRAMQDEDI